MSRIADSTIITQFSSELQATCRKPVFWYTALICVIWKIKQIIFHPKGAGLFDFKYLPYGFFTMQHSFQAQGSQSGRMPINYSEIIQNKYKSLTDCQVSWCLFLITKCYIFLQKMACSSSHLLLLCVCFLCCFVSFVVFVPPPPQSPVWLLSQHWVVYLHSGYGCLLRHSRLRDDKWHLLQVRSQEIIFMHLQFWYLVKISQFILIP